MRYLLVRTVGTVKYVNVKQVIIAPVKPQIKLRVLLVRMQPDQNQFRVLNALPERMPTLLVPYLAKIVALIPTNGNPMLRNVLKSKVVITVLVQQPKWSVQPVNPVPVATPHAKIAGKERSKALQVKPLATTAPADGAMTATVRPAATPYHRGRTLWTVFKPFANAVTRVPVQTHHEHHAPKVRTPTTRVPSPAFLVHRVHLPAKKAVLDVTSAL
jgi:hypothetical protein